MNKLTRKQTVIGFGVALVLIPSALFLDRSGYIRLLPKSELERLSDESARELNEVLVKEQEIACEYERKRGDFDGEECKKLREMQK